jgi:hypothetical protein
VLGLDGKGWVILQCVWAYTLRFTFSLLGEGWRMPFDATFWFCILILFDYTLFLRRWMVFEMMVDGGLVLSSLIGSSLIEFILVDFVPVLHFDC